VRSGSLSPNLPHMKLLAILFWASLLGGALSVFLDPDFPSIFEIIERF
jgi:hypothetical protein